MLTCFVDLKKAFDTVSRDLLLYKLVKLGIRGKYFAVIEDMYNNSLSKIKIDGLLSSPIKMERGTEQGHPLSPDLFKLFIRDLSELFYTTGDYPFLNNTLVNHLLWADDLVLLALDNESLQNNINILKEFCDKWGLAINIKKTKIVNFHRGKASNDLASLFLGNELIECKTSYCYLGITFYQNGSFKVAISELRKKALRSLYSLRRNIIKSSLSVKSLLLLFDCLIKPVLLYGCQVITPHIDITKYLGSNLCHTNSGETFLKRIARDTYEQFHIKYIKWCLGVHAKASNIGCWGDTGRYPIAFEAIKLSIDYFNRVEHSDANSLLHEALMEQKNLRLDWYENMSAVIAMFGSGNSKYQSINAIKKIQPLFSAKWEEGLNNSPKLEFYKTLKGSFGFENYLSVINDDKQRNALTRLRISAHNLHIERGRYARPPLPRDNRFCLYCKITQNQLVVEDELHVLNDCPLYSKAISSYLDCDNTGDRHEILINRDKSHHISTLSGKLALVIQDAHNAFSEHFKSESIPISLASQTLHQSMGPCVIL